MAVHKSLYNAERSCKEAGLEKVSLEVYAAVMLLTWGNAGIAGAGRIPQ